MLYAGSDLAKARGPGRDVTRAANSRSLYVSQGGLDPIRGKFGDDGVGVGQSHILKAWVRLGADYRPRAVSAASRAAGSSLIR
jgi:hypothetical protein